MILKNYVHIFYIIVNNIHERCKNLRFVFSVVWCRRWPQLCIVMAAQQTRVSYVCLVWDQIQRREKKCKNITDNIRENYLFFSRTRFSKNISKLNPFCLQIRHYFAPTFYNILYFLLQSTAREMSGPTTTLPTPSYDPPAWAGKPSAGLHLDVTKDSKLVQKLMIDEKKCYLFGRNPQMNDFTIDHGSCSRVHAALLWHKHLERSFLVDLGSSKWKFYLLTVILRYKYIICIC